MSIPRRTPRKADESPSAYFARGLPRGPLVQQIQYLHEVFLHADATEDPNVRLAFEHGLTQIATFTAASEHWRYDPDRPPPAISSKPLSRTDKSDQP